MSEQRDPLQIPEQFRVVADEIDAETWEKLQRVQTVMTWALEHGIPCGGRPGHLECATSPFTLIFLHGQAFAVCCIECVDAVVAAIFKAGHGTLMQESIQKHVPESLAKFSTYRRKVHLEAGQFVIPQARRR